MAITTRPLTEDEQRAMLEALGNLRDQVLFLTGLFTGFRITEVLRLTVGHVWRDGAPVHEITLSRRFLKGGAGAGKRGLSSRTVPVHDSLRAAIQTYLSHRFAHRPVDLAAPLFPGLKPPYAALSRFQGYRIVKAAARAANIDFARVATHSMRKSFAKQIFHQTGHNLVLLQKALGHRAIETTAKYVSPGTEEVNAAILGMHGNFPTHLPHVELVKPLPSKMAAGQQILQLG
jgi:integrase